MIDALIVTVFAPLMKQEPVLPCICGRCAAEDRFFTCAKCNRPTPWCRGADDQHYDLCDDCAIEAREHCYYGTSDCSNDLWQCQTCQEWFCDVHWHDTSLGYCVECVACERERLKEETLVLTKPALHHGIALDFAMPPWDSVPCCFCCGSGTKTLTPCPICGEMLCQDCTPPFGAHVCEPE